MIENKFLLRLSIGLLFVVLLMLLMSSSSAEMVTAKVDDKGLIANYYKELVGTLHTEYGEITVRDDDYNLIKINNTIRYNTDIPFWSNYWDVEVIN